MRATIGLYASVDCDYDEGCDDTFVLTYINEDPTNFPASVVSAVQNAYSVYRAKDYA